MIVAFSKAGRSLKNDNYIEIAKKISKFYNRKPNG